jgi:hypothetical protein
VVRFRPWPPQIKSLRALPFSSALRGRSSGRTVPFRAANGNLATQGLAAEIKYLRVAPQSKVALQLRIADRLADSLSAGPPDRRANSTPVLATYQLGCGRIVLSETRVTASPRRGAETRSRSGHLVIAECCLSWDLDTREGPKRAFARPSRRRRSWYSSTRHRITRGVSLGLLFIRTDQMSLSCKLP